MAQARDYGRLTSVAVDGGQVPGDLARMLSGLPALFPDELRAHLLDGLDDADGAAVYAWNGSALVLAVSNCPPPVDDARTYGAIAANAALGGVFARGGRPLMALNLATIPEDMPAEVTVQILRGAAEQTGAAGAVVAGGHIVGGELHFGLAVLGTVDPERLIRRSGARPGDRLVLTKPVGVSAIIAAARRGSALPEAMAAAVGSMLASSAAASEAAMAAGVRCGVQVAGRGLIGHALEVSRASGVQIRIRSDRVPLLPGALHHTGAGDLPEAARLNRASFAPHTEVGAAVEPLVRELLFAPETAGGLLLVVPGAALHRLATTCAAAGVEAAVVGEACRGRGLLLE